jgi:predicted phage gp36 major capsid-like protein
MQARPVMTMGAGGQLEQKVDENGNNVWQFDSNGANKALELLGKHVAMFTDKHKVDANVDFVVTGMEVK